MYVHAYSIYTIVISNLSIYILLETATSQEVCPCNTTLYDQLNEEFHQTRDLLLYRDKRLRQKSRITRRRLQEVEEAIKMKWNTTNLLPNAGQMRIEPNSKYLRGRFNNGYY